MPIRVSSTKQIEALVADLRSPDAVKRDAAIARLTVIGARAVERVIAVAEAGSAPAPARAAAWRALEAIGDPRALDPALHALASPAIDADVGAAATGVARMFVRGPRGAAVVDRLTTVVLDPSRQETLRVAALRVLRTLEPATIAPLMSSLADDPSAAVLEEREAFSRAKKEREPFRRAEPKERAAFAPQALGRASPKLAGALSERRGEGFSRAVSDAAEKGLADDSDALRTAIAHAGADAPLEHLRRIVERVREREGAEPAAKRDQWRKVRAAAHVALAKRGSRLALYDLRESLEKRVETMPVELMTALSLVGDTSCLEAIAAAHAKTRDAWWRQHLAEAFYTIVAREKLTQRHAVMKRIAKKWTLA